MQRTVSPSRGRGAVLAAGLAMALTLAACGSPQSQTPPQTQAPETAAIQAPAEPTPPPKPKITADQLLGQDAAWVREKLGEPAFVRTERHANLWQYKSDGCALNLFLYKDGSGDAAGNAAGNAGSDGGGPARVLHFDARDLGGANTGREACLSAVQE